MKGTRDDSCRAVTCGLGESLPGGRPWTLVDELRKHAPAALIALVGVPPLSSFPLLPQPLRAVIGIRARMFDDAAKAEVSKKENVVYVPIEIEPAPCQFSPDGFHPSPSMYKELGQQVAAAIRSGLQSHSEMLSIS